MKENKENEYIKRKQKEYRYALKLFEISDIETCSLRIKAAARNIGFPFLINIFMLFDLFH